MARSPTYFLSCKGELTSDRTSKRQLIVISGCTSVGKSAVANLLCNRVDSEIIIADRCSLHSLMYDYFLNILESGNDIVNMTTEEIALKEEEINEGYVLII